MDHGGAKKYILQRLKEGLDPRRTYHSLGHTLDVYASAIDIAREEKIIGDDLSLLKTAALYHDCGFLEADKKHEEAGCAIISRELPRFSFPEAAIERITAMVLATRIPQAPEDHLAEVLCDADLDYLGRPDFKLVGNTLFQEFKAYGTCSTEEEWNRLQVTFLERHSFFTETNKRNREPLKQRHLQELKAMLNGGAVH